ncbi:hypothetical protein Hanom_Chr08g00726111 [Helianthus anomalus]
MKFKELLKRKGRLQEYIECSLQVILYIFGIPVCIYTKCDLSTLGRNS